MMFTRAISKASSERRYKRLVIPNEVILLVFNAWRDPPKSVVLPVRDELPKDCVVIRARHDWDLDQFELIVCSESFEPLEDGVSPPLIDNACSEMNLVFLTKKVENVAGN